MSSEFLKECHGDLLSWCGQPMIYDGVLCVCRSAEDLVDRRQHWKCTLLV